MAMCRKQLVGLFMLHSFSLIINYWLFPIYLNSFVDYLQTGVFDVPIYSGWWLAIILFVIQFLDTITISIRQMTSVLSIQTTKTTLQTEAFGKILRLSPNALANIADGKIVNIINNDIEFISKFADSLMNIIFIPAKIILGIYFLAGLIGIAVLPALGVLIL
ncbi:hypothetical protein HDU91_004043, partial [Kappamyces sp. JEL0680]